MRWTSLYARLPIWNFGEDRSISFWDTGVPKSTIKKNKKIKKERKNIGKIYSLSGKFAKRAKTI